MRLLFAFGFFCLFVFRAEGNTSPSDQTTTWETTTVTTPLWETDVINITDLKENLYDSIIFQIGLNQTITPSVENETAIEPLPLPDEEEVENFTRIAEEKFNETEVQNINLMDIDTFNNVTSIFGPHLLTDKESIAIHKPGTIMATATEEIVQNAREKQGKVFKRSTFRHHLDSFDRFQIFDLVHRMCPHTVLLPSCQFSTQIQCNCLHKYRTIDGSCNNIDHPYWGKSHTPLERFLTPEYEGTQAPRTISESGAPLPGARTVSSLVHGHSTLDDLTSDFSYAVMLWGQFLDHDITKTALSKGYDNRNLECCNPDVLDLRGDCLPIEVPTGDRFYPPTVNCLNFVRSIATPTLDCSVGYRQQLNEITHFIDASNVYGSTEEELAELRDGTTARLKVSDEDRLPLDIPNDSECILSNSNRKCFKAGDKRANVQPALSSLHTIFVREHNRIADYIRDNNPQWNDEKVFQEARRFVGAEMQHITYNDFLPKILHNIFITSFDLKPQKSGFFTAYNPHIKPMIRNGFATAAYRFGHSLLRDNLKFGSRSESLHSQFNNPDFLYNEEGIEKCTKGIYEWESQKIDEKMTPEITDRLFERLFGSGGDLAAFNIQRGRDHGLPPYNKWLHACYNLKAYNFDPGVFGGLVFHDANEAAKLKIVYEHPDDIDLFAGGISERPLPGSKLGPTFSCIIGLQFQALKYGDRFYYEGNTPSNPCPFEESKLNSIRQVTLAKIICDNTNIETIPSNVFMLPDPISNPYVNCSDLPSLMLPCTPVTGGWSSWTIDCIKGVQQRTCTNPKPTACGQHCCH